MTLVRFDEVSLEFGDTPLLVEANFAIEIFYVEDDCK